MEGNLRPDICQRSWQLTRISVEWEAAGPVNVRNATNPQLLTAVLSCPPAALASCSGLSAPPYTFTNAKCLESCCASNCKSRGTPLQRYHCSPAGKGSWSQVCAGDWKPDILAKRLPAFLLPHRLQEVTGAAYASDSSPPSCMVPSSSDKSFRSMNFPSFVNGTDFMSWANASGSWRKRREVSKLQQPLRNTHFPVLLSKLLQLWLF